MRIHWPACRSGSVKLAIAALSMTCAAGCADQTELSRGRVVVSELPDPEKAYLVVGANVIPSHWRQPTWIGVHKRGRHAHLATELAVFELNPGEVHFCHVDFQQNPMSGNGTLHFGRVSPGMELKPGMIHYFGRLEVDGTVPATSIRAVRDLDLYRRACEQAPELFRAFEIEIVGPLSRKDELLPGCDELQ